MTKPIKGVHDSKDLPQYMEKMSAVQRKERTRWLLVEFGYGTRREAHTIDTTRYRENSSLDLLEVSENPNAKVLDLGCGPGNSTEVILEMLPAKTVIGIDPSQDFLDQASKGLKQYVDEGRLHLKKARAENLDDVVGLESIDLVFGMVVWQFFNNTRHALEQVQKVLRPGGKFTTFISSTHYGFELPQSPEGPITYLGSLGQAFIISLESEIYKTLGVMVDCDSRISHQFNTLGTVRDTANAAGLKIVKYEEKDWPYEKAVLETKLRGEPRRIMMHDRRIADLLESGKVSIDQINGIVNKVVDKTLASDEYKAYEGRFTERWGAFVLQKPYY